MKLSTSLIITTYNWPEALRVVLESVNDQVLKPSEIVIADDGSKPETGRVVREVLGSTGLRWSHVRHEDNGVRQSRIKNLAVQYSTGDYLIFVDHDTVLHPYFVKDHFSMMESGSFLQGKRVLLPDNFSKKVLKKGEMIKPDLGTKGLGNGKNLFHNPFLGRLISRKKVFDNHIRGCNFSLFKKDYLRVDGFDESFDGSWGREDSDICYRLYNNGIRIRTLWFSAIQYHLFHSTMVAPDLKRMDEILNDIIVEKRSRALKGYSRLSEEGGIVASSDSLLNANRL